MGQHIYGNKQSQMVMVEILREREGLLLALPLPEPSRSRISATIGFLRTDRLFGWAGACWMSTIAASAPTNSKSSAH